MHVTSCATGSAWSACDYCQVGSSSHGNPLLTQLFLCCLQGVDWAGSGSTNSPPQLAGQVCEQARQPTPTITATSANHAAAEAMDSDESDYDDQELDVACSTEVLSLAEVEKTAAASITWSRCAQAVGWSTRGTMAMVFVVSMNTAARTSSSMMIDNKRITVAIG